METYGIYDEQAFIRRLYNTLQQKCGQGVSHPLENPSRVLPEIFKDAWVWESTLHNSGPLTEPDTDPGYPIPEALEEALPMAAEAVMQNHSEDASLRTIILPRYYQYVVTAFRLLMQEGEMNTEVGIYLTRHPDASNDQHSDDSPRL